MAEQIDFILNEKDKKLAFGGYLEKRTLYDQSSLFQSDYQERNIHLGVDFWAKKGTKVKCPEEGVVHSFAFNLSSTILTKSKSIETSSFKAVF